MQSPHSHSNRELFFVLQDLTPRFQRYLSRLKPMSQVAEATQIANVNVFYKKDKDVALMCLGFDADFLTTQNHKRILRLATIGGFAVIDPERLSSTDRGFFYQDYLRRYAVSATDHRSPTSALQVLGRQLGIVEGAAKDLMESPAELDSQLSPELVFDKDDKAKTKSKRLGSNREPLSMEIPLVLASPADVTSYGAEVKTNPVKPTVKPIVTVDLSDDFPASEEDVLDHIGLGPAGRPFARGKGKRSQRLSTIPARPSNAPGSAPRLKLALPPMGEDEEQPQPKHAATRKRRVSSAPLVNNGEQEPVRVRYQRGDTWMPARLRNLTTKDIRLAASAAPPSGSTLRVSVTIGEHNAVLSGTVVEVVNTEGSTDGSTTFRIDFGDIGKRERERLVLLLRKAKRLGMALTPPPARRDRRFAISWPIAVVSEGRRFNAAALDISERGLFLSTTNMIRSSQLIFGLPLDRDGATVKGRASVARKVNEHMARSRGLSLGYGLQIEDFSIEDDEQYAKFLIRVRRRSQIHVLLAGKGERCEQLASCFQGAGYAVSTVASVEAMMHRTQFESCPPNVAVLECGSLHKKDRREFVSTFVEHDVPLLQAAQMAPHIARNSLDQMVEI